MSRRKEMNKGVDHGDVVYSGWMVKSPPENKLTGPWKIFRAFSTDPADPSSWKRRFFVLSKPAGSLPGAYLLNYFSDENCKKRKGYIDLEQCLEIIESLDSDKFQYLLAIKTTHKSKERTYFLSTETEEQMTTWVRNLCSVCGMKPDEPPEPAQQKEPEELRWSPQAASVKQQSRSIPAANHTQLAPLSATAPPTSHSSVPITKQPAQPKQEKANHDSQYFPLEECHSGNSFRNTSRQDSVDSVPSDPAPPPPVKTGPLDLDEVFAPNVYDHPKATQEDDVYKVPPVRPQLTRDDMYDVPPSITGQSSHSPCSSSGDSQRADSIHSQGASYDIPPTRAELLREDEVYDIPPSHSQPVGYGDQPPGRPPKPKLTTHAQEPYMNLPTNSRVLTDINQGVDINNVLPPSSCGPNGLGDTYDLPRSTLGDLVKDRGPNDSNLTQLLLATPPPPSCGINEHKYLNAASGYVQENQEEPYLEMDPKLKSLDPVPAVPRRSSSTDHEGEEYTDMSGKSSFEDSFESVVKPVYDQLPVRPSVRPNMPPRPVKTSASSAASEGDTYSIFSTSRTRSFKRSTSSTSSPMMKRRLDKVNEIIEQTTIKEDEESNNNGSNSLSKTSVPLPVRMDIGRDPDFSSSSEDEDGDLVDTDKAGIWCRTPPAPSKKEPELKYLELGLADNTDKEPMRSPLVPPGQSSPTEYREIDFVKTQALVDVKKWRNT